MLYALGTPLALVALLVGFVAGVVAHGTAQALTAARLGDRGAGAGRTRPKPGRHLDPFGAIAAAIAGLGWGKPLELRRQRFASPGRFVAAVLAGPVANLLLAAAAVGGYLALGGPLGPLGALPISGVVRGQLIPTDPAEQVLLLFGIENLGMALLSLVPLPPLDGGRLLFGLGPRSSGWQRAEYYLVEQNYGLVALLVLLVLPLGSGVPPLLYLLDTVARPLLGLIPGAG